MTTPAPTRHDMDDMDALEALADLVDEHYVLADLAPVYAGRIRAHAASLASHLPDVDGTNAALHALVPDRHLSLRHPRQTVPGPATPLSSPHGGVHRVGHLEHGVWLVEIHPVFTAPVEALPALQSVAHDTAKARGLMLDLRRCFGGDTDTAALIHGWLLGPTPVHLGRFERRGHPSTEYVSDPAVGTHYAGPVRVLTSTVTFSGGEDLAYVLQAHGRARVVGERTAGGAHPVEHFPLPGGRTCQIPVARSVITATGANWEGTGVTPDTPSPAHDALEQALRELASEATT